MDRKHSHIIVVGVDGAGSFIKDADTPNFDRIFANGAVTYNALSSNPSISTECWGAMLLGVGPEIHKLTNGIVSSTPYPTDSSFPSLFRRIKEAYPEAELGSQTGKGVNNTEIEEMNIRDLAAIVLYSFGIKAPEFDENGWTSQIPDGIFDDSSIPAYRDISHLTGAAPRISKIPHTSELIQNDGSNPNE